MMHTENGVCPTHGAWQRQVPDGYMMRSCPECQRSPTDLPWVLFMQQRKECTVTVPESLIGSVCKSRRGVVGLVLKTGTKAGRTIWEGIRIDGSNLPWQSEFPMVLAESLEKWKTTLVTVYNSVNGGT